MRIAYLSDEVIAQQAAELLTKHGLHMTIPVDVELLLEAYLGLEIIPITLMRERFGIDGTISQDLTIIYVDERTQRDAATRYRFTLAHELGHRQLHRDLIEEFLSKATDNVQMLWEALTDQEYSRAERQAHVFAGALLMPLDHVTRAFQALQEQIA